MKNLLFRKAKGLCCAEAEFEVNERMEQCRGDRRDRYLLLFSETM
jgi:hypothetical protein